MSESGTDTKFLRALLEALLIEANDCPNDHDGDLMREAILKVRRAIGVSLVKVEAKQADA